jgi:hypothetical protein
MDFGRSDRSARHSLLRNGVVAVTYTMTYDKRFIGFLRGFIAKQKPSECVTDG